MDAREEPLGSNHPVLGPFVRSMDALVLGPARWFRKTVVDPARGEAQPWYHRQYNRVPTIDECYIEDVVCREEANAQFKRDWMVEQEIVSLLRDRMQDCFFYEKGTGMAHLQVAPKTIIDLTAGSQHVCKPISDTYERAAENYFIKYGEISGYNGRAEAALSKQKHRMMWERRHGAV
ncbi:unnamed protein product, partial [Ectocarpus sp. 8 AP-2014]